MSHINFKINMSSFETQLFLVKFPKHMKPV